MDNISFITSLQGNEPPQHISVYLLALWYNAKGDWHKAHETIEHVNTQSASWIHAYLHRAEGDLFNADYWYTKAGKKRPVTTLQDEWQQLVDELINAN